jgi:23S rRNA (cytidine2498-2'-O)-methyltransferase
MCGNVRLVSPLSRPDTLAILREAPTRYIARVTPLDTVVRLSQEPDSLPLLREALPWRELLHPGQTFVIRCERRGEQHWESNDLKRSLGRFLEAATGAEAILEDETDIEVGVEVFGDLAFVGVYAPAERLLKRILFRRKYAPGQRPLNRAELKLREALKAFAIEPAPAWRALDIGAAPGGWSRVLASLVAEVIAVDPADLDPEVAALPNVRHLRCKAESLDLQSIGPVDLLVDDMNKEGPESAAILAAAAPLLPPGAPAVMTVKFMSHRWRRVLIETRSRLRPAFDVLAARRLPHNRNEMTFHLRRSSLPPPETPCPPSPSTT